MGHFEVYPIDTLTCNRLNDYERNILEREGEIFAEELLMPREWLARNKKLGITDLQRIFGVPAEFLSARVRSAGE